MPDTLAFWHALCFGTGRHLLGLPGSFMRRTVCPKSCVSGRKLRISNCSPESQKKEKVSPPGWYRMNFMYMSGTGFQVRVMIWQPDVYFVTGGRMDFMCLCLDAGFQLQAETWQDIRLFCLRQLEAGHLLCLRQRKLDVCSAADSVRKRNRKRKKCLFPASR